MQIEFDFSDEQELFDGFLRFSDTYETEVYINGEWILLEDYYKQQKK
jgi:hypothetical protein